jgi:hypothetical protein
MKNLLLLSLLFCAPFLSFSQNRSDRNSEIESYKIAYLTQKLELSSDDAKTFWPIYTEYQKEQSVLRREKSEKMISLRKIDEIDKLTDPQVATLLSNEFNYKQKELNLERKYYNIFKTKLPIKTLGKYYRAQETFKKELLNRFRRSNPTTVN